ncbi:MAG: hypothetical protein ACRDIV_01105 [Ktedonobacteraceae bacterium]
MHLLKGRAFSAHKYITQKLSPCRHVAMLTSHLGYVSIGLEQKIGKGETIVALRKEQINDTYYEERQAMKERTRITIDISPELRQRIKVAAFQQNISISEYLGRILEDAVPREISYSKEMKPLTREKLEQALRVRERIIENTGGYTFDDSTEIVRQMRDERTKEQEQL